MPYYNYYCTECDTEELRHIPLVDDVFTEQVLVSSLSQEEIDALPDWDDPRDYEVYEEVKYGDMPPNTVKCNNCGDVADRLVDGAPTIKHGRNSYHALKERQRYHHYGMDKKQGDKFLEESIEASKKRRKDGSQHYAKVVPNYEVLEKEGIVKRLDDKEKAEKRNIIKDVNRSLTKESTLGRGAKNKKS